MRQAAMFGPDFPFAYDDFLKNPAGIGKIPETAFGTEVAVIGAGIAGIVAAYELMKLGLKPVIYESDRIGGGCGPSRSRMGMGRLRNWGRCGFRRLRPPCFITSRNWV